MRAGANTASPLADRLNVIGVPVLVERLSCPVELPVCVGSKSTVQVADWPGASEMGVVRFWMAVPLHVALYPEPLTDPPEIVAVAVPVEVTVNDCVADVPTVTCPKDSDAALADRFGTASVTPVPEVATVVGVADALLEIEMDPESVPELDGANFTFTETC